MQTVLGVVDSGDLGITLPHEHLIIDLTCWFIEPSATSEKPLAYQPVTLENLGWIRCNSHSNIDCMQIQDVQLAIDEARLFKEAGGNTIFDATSIGLGRDPNALVRIAQATGLNIIMGSGCYVDQSLPKDFGAKSEKEIADGIVNDITVGVGVNRVRAGFIGEIGNTWPWTEGEKKRMRAAAAAQKRTGAALMIHPGFSASAPFEHIKLLQEEGADINHTIMCHMEAVFTKFEERCELANTGCYLEFDNFGRDGYFDAGACEDFSDIPTPAALVAPNDLKRIDQIKELIDAGYLHQILVSTDICKKTLLTHYGSFGYGHILRHIVPLMHLKGISENDIHTLIVENPKRAFSFT